MPRAYLSSTQQDLVAHRKRAIEVIQSCGLDVRAMEFYTATSDQPRRFCVEDVAECDLYIGLFAFRYGHVPTGEVASITEQEYLQACQAGLPVLIFLVKENTLWDPKFRDQGKDAERIAALRSRLQNEHMIAFFTTPDDLATQLATALANYQAGERQKRLGPLGLAVGQCPQCKYIHAHWQAHSVCERCGTTMQEPCPGCDTPNGVWSQHCRSCKVDIPHELQAMRKEVDGVLKEVAAHVRARELEQALKLLDQLHLPAHSQFAERRAQVERERIRLREAVGKARETALHKDIKRRLDAADWLAAARALAALRQAGAENDRLEDYRDRLAEGLREALLASPEDRDIRQLYLAERTPRQRSTDEREGRQLESRALWMRLIPLLVLGFLIVPLLLIPRVRSQILERSAPKRFRDFGPLPWEALTLNDRELERKFLAKTPGGKLEDGFQPLKLA